MRQRVNATPVVASAEKQNLLSVGMEKLDLDDNNILDSLETTPELERVFKSLRKCLDLRQKYMAFSYQLGKVISSLFKVLY
jgi:hypothetical protein